MDMCKDIIYGRLKRIVLYLKKPTLSTAISTKKESGSSALKE